MRFNELIVFLRQLCRSLQFGRIGKGSKNKKSFQTFSLKSFFHLISSWLAKQQFLSSFKVLKKKRGGKVQQNLFRFDLRSFVLLLRKKCKINKNHSKFITRQRNTCLSTFTIKFNYLKQYLYNGDGTNLKTPKSSYKDMHFCFFWTILHLLFYSKSYLLFIAELLSCQK